MSKILETTTEDRLITTRDAANATGYHQTHFNNLLAKGTIKGVKGENGRWQFKQSELDKYLNSNEVKPRRSKKYTEKEPENGPSKSLFTQLDEKEKELQIAQGELSALKRMFDDVEEKHKQEISGAKNTIAQLEETNNEQAIKIKSLEDTIKDLHDQIYEHNQFIRDILREFLHSFTGTENKTD